LENPVSNPPSRVTQLLAQLEPGDSAVTSELIALVYDELRALAARQLQHERAGHTLQPTALVHEAWLRLAQGAPVAWQGRAHFFRIAARVMRQVLVDSARRRNAVMHGGGQHRVTLDHELIGDAGVDRDLLELHDALERLGRLDASLEQLIELRFFTGLTLDEAAAALGVSRRKAAKDWAAARIWLHRELAET
jgi:RNA polymerase sigma factor (TIGR02999 family)